MADTKRSALGKGLSALIPDAPEPRAGVIDVDVDRLRPNPYQPRRGVDDARLDEHGDLLNRQKGNGGTTPPQSLGSRGNFHKIHKGRSNACHLCLAAALPIDVSPGFRET